MSVDTLGYKKGSGEDEELTFSLQVKMGKGGSLWWDLDSASACHPPRSETSTKAHYEIDVGWEDHTVCICEHRSGLLVTLKVCMVCVGGMASMWVQRGGTPWGWAWAARQRPWTEAEQRCLAGVSTLISWELVKCRF